MFSFNLMIVRNGPFEQLWGYVCDGSIISVAATPNCSVISAATINGSLYLLDGRGCILWKKEKVLENEGWSTAISSDGKLIAVGTANKKLPDGRIHIFDREGRTVFADRIGAPVWGLSFSSDGSKLAVAAWNNHAYFFRYNGSHFEKQDIDLGIKGAKGGLYGIKLSSNGELCVAAAYDYGLFILGKDGQVIHQYESDEGLYNIGLCQNASRICTGVRRGSFLIGSPGPNGCLYKSERISQRPICGIAITNDGQLLACGSFDGRIIIATERGDTLWSLETEGEVWSTAISTDGSLVCAGSGDQVIRLIKNRCHSSALEEVLAWERNVLREGNDVGPKLLNELAELYLNYGLVDYGFKKLREFIRLVPDERLMRNQLRVFLEASLAAFPTHHQAHFNLGCLLMEEMNYIEGAKRFQYAKHSPVLRSVALRKAAECFGQNHMTAATASAFRQAREQYLDGYSRQILFNLALSYEDEHAYRSAARIYELLASWDVAYRNVYEKWRHFSQLSATATGTKSGRRDYEPGTTSLMGPDGPRDVGKSLGAILKARKKEIAIGPDEVRAVKDVVEDLLADEKFSRGITRKLEYTRELILKYEFGLPEDEMKKILETVTALPFIKKQLIHHLCPSLDIGAATGRYPFLLKRLGFQATGIDKESRAVQFAKAKTGGMEWPRFICGDALELEKHFGHEKFHLVTCMMGTFDHIEKKDQLSLLSKLYDALNLNGLVIISLWDIECQHLAYLSIYDEVQKELIRKNSPTWAEMSESMGRVGFRNVTIRPFCMLPQMIIYDLGIERMGSEDIQMAAHADLAARALFAERHGEMYLAIGEKIK